MPRASVLLATFQVFNSHLWHHFSIFTECLIAQHWSRGFGMLKEAISQVLLRRLLVFTGLASVIPWTNPHHRGWGGRDISPSLGSTSSAGPGFCPTLHLPPFPSQHISSFSNLLSGLKPSLSVRGQTPCPASPCPFLGLPESFQTKII